MSFATRFAAPVALLLACSLPAAAQQKDKEYEPQVGQAGKDVIWVPTPDEVVNRMLRMAQVTQNDGTYGSQSRSFTSNWLGHVTSETHPETGTTSYTFFNDGRVATRTDARGIVTNYSYDDVGRLTTVTYDNDGGVTPDVTHTYDQNGFTGFLTTANVSGVTSSTFEYDNAGTAESMPFLKTERAFWDRLIAENATSAFLVSRAFIGGMADRGAGRIVMVASVSGKRGAPYIAAYVASKHAMLGLMRSLAAEFGPKGVRVNAVCPGYVDTPMTERSVSNVVAKTGRSASEARKAMEEMNPQKRFLRPDEVAAAVLPLLDPACAKNGEAIDL